MKKNIQGSLISTCPKKVKKANEIRNSSVKVQHCHLLVAGAVQ